MVVGFLIGLIVIVSAFAAVGKPVTLPPHTSDDVKVRGSVVSETAKNLDNKADVEAEVDADVNLGTENSDREAEVDADVNVEAATKVAAYNTKSGKVMRALIPQVAIDNSVALEAYSITEAESSDVKVSNNTSLNAKFGQSVATSQPGSAKTDGKAFGSTTSQTAVGNRNR